MVTTHTIRDLFFVSSMCTLRTIRLYTVPMQSTGVNSILGRAGAAVRLLTKQHQRSETSWVIM